MSLGPSTVSTGENVTVHMRAFNRAPTSLTLNASEIIDPFEAPCGLGIRALGLDVYPGHYTLGNLSTAPAPLMLYNASVVPSCPVAFVYRYTFQPESSTASVEAFSSNSTVDATYAVSLGGYWVNCCSPGPGPSYSYVKFQPGQYTVVVFDAWDQRAVESFIVS